MKRPYVVHALDARTERMDEGVRAVQRLGLTNIKFEQRDIRDVTLASHRIVDIVLLLGILYHLDQRDVFFVLKNVYELCTQFVIIDTHVAQEAEVEVEYDGHVYQGLIFREHAERDSDQVRRKRLLASLDNSTSFWFTKDSLFRLLRQVGFSTVSECFVPLVPLRQQDRVTIIAVKGEPMELYSYPWLNNLSEQEIECCLAKNSDQLSRDGFDIKSQLKEGVNKLLRLFGLKIVRR